MDVISRNLILFWSAFFIIWALLLTMMPPLKYRIMQMIKKPPMRLLFANIAIIIGMIHILYHNIWEYDIRIVITIFGWLSFIKGLSLIIWPNLVNVAESILTSKYFSYYLVFMLAIGLYLFKCWLNIY